jgi:hypothetical protein
MFGCNIYEVGENKMNLKEWLKETINNSPFLPEKTKEECAKIIDKEKK